MSIMRFVTVVCCLCASFAFAKDVRLSFKEGAVFHVKATEQLKLTMQGAQVDPELVEPSIRITEYHFTETIEKVLADGSANIAATLDSFKTTIYLDKVDDRNEFFRFNSTNEFDIQNRLKHISALPRAQFLGQTIRYTIGTDGLIKSFTNLKDFHNATIGRAFEYDMMRALLSFSDSLRVGQLLEQGAGALAALGAQTKPVLLPYTFTEIKLDREIAASRNADGKIVYEGKLTNPPRMIEYLEGIDTKMEINNFAGTTKGEIQLTGGIITGESITETGSMVIKIDVEDIKHRIDREYNLTREPIKVIRGTVRIEEKERHKAEWKEPKPDPNMIMIDPMTGKYIYPEGTPPDSTKAE
jgi:hypothetical protein